MAVFARIKPIAVKEFRQIARDKWTLALILVFPAFLMVLFGYALNFDVKHITLAVWDQDRSAASREFVQSFFNSEYFDLVQHLDGPGEINKLLDEGRAQAVLTVPPDFSVRLARGEDVAVQVNIDGANSNSATAVLGYVNLLCQGYSTRILTRTLQRAGPMTLELPIDYRPRVWYNPELRSSRFLIPGLIVLIMLIMTVVSTALSVVREKERGTMEQMIVSPVTPLEVVLGKTIPYVFTSLVGAAIVLLAGWVLFGIVVKGSWLLLAFALLIFVLCGLGMGLLISTVTDSQQAAFMISALVTMLPAIILSGFIFPIRNMPAAIQAVTYLIPARYFLPILRSIILKGVGLEAFWRELLLLAAFAVVAVTLSAVRLGKQMR